MKQTINQFSVECDDKNIRRLLLHGNTGVGKTVTLFALAVYARFLGWLTVYVPNTDIFLAHGGYSKDISKLKWNTPDAAKELLQSIVNLNGKELLMKCKTKTEAGKRIGDTLLDIAVSAQNAPEDANDLPVDAAIVFRHELEVLDKADGIPGAIVCIDDYNSLFGNSKFSESVSLKSRRKIKTSELKLAAAWRDLSCDSKEIDAILKERDGVSRMLMVVANSEQYDYLLPLLGSRTRIDFEKLDRVHPSLPMIFRTEDPCRCIARLQPFDPKEIEGYMDRVKMYNTKVDEEQACKIAAISGGNGVLLRKSGLFY